MNKYLVQFTVETSLESHIGDCEFSFKNAVVKFLFSTKKDNRLKARVILEATNYKDAYTKAHDEILTNVVDIISFIMKSPLLILEMNHVLKAEKGKERIIYIEMLKKEWRHLFMRNKYKQEIQRFLDNNKNLDEKYRLVLRWLRFGYHARTPLEKFIYYWLAIERIIGEKKISRKCPHCNKTISHLGIPKYEVRQLLNRYDEFTNNGDFGMIWSLRQKVFHGGKTPVKDLLIQLSDTIPKLTSIIEKALLEKIKPKVCINVRQPLPFKDCAHYKFTTKYPESEFATDYPTEKEVKQDLLNPTVDKNLKFQLLYEEEAKTISDW